MGATYGALLRSLSSSFIGGLLQAATALGLATKTSVYSFRISISASFSDGESWPMLASSRLFCRVRGSRPVAPGYLVLSSCPSVRLTKELQETLDPRNAIFFHTVYSGCSDSLRDRDRCGGHIRDHAFKRVARFPPLYPAGNSHINSPLEV